MAWAPRPRPAGRLGAAFPLPAAKKGGQSREVFPPAGVITWGKMGPPSTHLSLFAAMLGGPGRDRAWQTFLARYAPLIRAWCGRHGLRGADADDLTQDIAVKLFQRLPSYAPDRGKFRDWLAALVRNA